MLTREIRSQTLPYLHLNDKVYQALQLMNDNQVTHLPIVDGEKYIGIVSEEDLLLTDNDKAEIIFTFYILISESEYNIEINGDFKYLFNFDV